MELLQVRNEIRQKQIRPFYIFTGEEWQVRKIYIHKIAEIQDAEIVYIESLSEVYKSLSIRSLLEKNKVFVVMDDKELMKDDKQILSLNKDLLNNNVVILIVSELDKRTKFYKTYKDIMVDFPLLEMPVLRKYVHKEINLSEKNTDILIEVCDRNYGRILLEIDKIKRYADGKDESFKILLSEGVIYEPPYDAIFDCVVAILKRQTSLAFELLDECKRIGEPVLTLLSVLYTNTKQVLQVQSFDGRDIEKSTGLTAWQIKKAREKCGHYSISELVYMLKLIHKVEIGIKSGKIDETIALDYVLCNVM